MPLSNLAEYKEAVRSDIVGNTSFMTATLPNGNILKSVVSVDESQTIVLTVTTTQTNRPQLQINFPVLADLRQAYYEDSFIEVNLPINLPLDAYPVVGLVLYLGKILLSAKIAKQVELAQRANPALLIPGIGLAPCIRHDLECTGLFGTGTFPWLSGSKVLFFFPCIGPVVADILDCCKSERTGKQKL